MIAPFVPLVLPPAPIIDRNDPRLIWTTPPVQFGDCASLLHGVVSTCEQIAEAAIDEKRSLEAITQLVGEKAERIEVSLAYVFQHFWPIKDATATNRPAQTPDLADIANAMCVFTFMNQQLHLRVQTERQRANIRATPVRYLVPPTKSVQ